MKLIFDPFLHYEKTTPLSGGQISVEIERPPCGLATSIANTDGTFSVSGAATGDVFVRLRPIDRPDLVTTIHRIPGANGIELPIVTRASLEGLFALATPKLTVDSTAAQVVVSFIDDSVPPGTLLSGGTIQSSAAGTIAYDGTNQTGPNGLALVLNAKANPYPGDRTSVTGIYPQRPQPTASTVLAQDSVSLLILGFQ